MDRVSKLLQKMEQGSLLPKLVLEQSDIVAALDQRDHPLFGDAWMRAFRQVEMKKGGKLDAEPRVGRLRELAYLQAYERWQSPDLAAYISDDFGLIGDALATNYNDEWLNGLLDAYLSLKFPYGSLPERSGDLGEDL